MFGQVIGVVHLLPLPGSPGYGGSVRRVIERARRDALAYSMGGADAILVENYGDAPFLKDGLAPETIAAFARCVAAIREETKLPLGVNALRNDARAALGIAVATGASFLRVNVHAGVVATDQGLIEGHAGETLRARAALRADVKILADVHVKHGRTLSSDNIAEAARDNVARGGADAIIVSGKSTGDATRIEDLRAVRAALPDVFLLAGSGVTRTNVASVLAIADAAIVGTALKRGGKTAGPVDMSRVKAFVKNAKAATTSRRRAT